LCSKRLKQIAKEKSEIDSKIVTYGSLQASREEKARGIRSEIPIGIASSADLESRVSKFEKELDNYEKDKKKVQQDRERLNTQCTEVSTRLDESRNQQTELEKRLLELSDKLTKKLTGAKFHTVDDVKTYLVENDEREAMDRALDKWKNKKIQLETKQKEILKNVKGKSRPDLDGFRRIEDELDNKEKETHNSITSIQERIKMDKNLLSQVKEGHKEILKIHSETTRLDNLARIANGDNNRKQPLQTFVLTAFLEDVIAAANLRLARFTHKRYELTRRLDPTGRQKKSGLDINVFDNYTGEERPAHTLSGGEMFLTSLSLALGLADVVSVHSGGFKLDAMFIDEGFGSLDDQTLDVAIQALIDLKEDGRIIGIISHVNELKERIPLRLEVIKSRKGSSVRWSRN
jgi:exonuclease SbcC